MITTTDLAHVPGARRRRTSTRLAIAEGARARRRPRREAPRGPRPLAVALERAARRELAPATLLAEVQRAGRRPPARPSRAQAEPVAERDGVVTVACASAVWAQELDLHAPSASSSALNGALGRPGGAARCAPQARAGSLDDVRAQSCSFCSTFVTLAQAGSGGPVLLDL